MALPVAGGNEYPPLRPSDGPYGFPVKRRTVDDDDDYHNDHSQHKRVKYVQHHPFAGSVAFRAVQEPLLSYPPPLHHPHPHHRYPSPIPRFGSPDSAAAPPMERTDSGHSIHPDPSEGCSSTELLEDREAAQRVRDHLASFRRRNPDSKHERILRSIINPRPRRHHRHHHHNNHHHHHHSHSDDQDEYPLDNAALESIFSATNEIFFNGRLSQRVAWDWSHTSSARYDSRVIGTTALRRAAASTRGFETLIVLSATILRDAKYSRRLLISTFLHELIHCYLFICCGFRARCCGGHTDGFKDIAVVIDEWVGEGGGLYLSRVEADLELFRIGGCGRDAGEARDRPVSVYPCSGMAAEQEEHAAAAAAVSGPAAQEVVYFTGGGAQSPEGSAVRSQELVYPGRGVSPIPRAGTPTREAVHYYDDRAAGGGSSDNARWRQRRAVRPIYVYSGDDPTASYVYLGSTPQRP